MAVRGRAFEYALRDELRPLARGRVAGCGRTKVTHAAWVKGQSDMVEIWSRDHDPILDGESNGKQKRNYYRNVMTCGSAWECPSCMARHRRQGAQKVKLAVERWTKGANIPATDRAPAVRVHPHGAGSVLFLTLTVAHALGHDLEAVRRGVTTAFSRLIAGEKWGRFCAMPHPRHFVDDYQREMRRDPSTAMERFGNMPRYIAGFVRALETTNGPNGWHPHIHALVFCEVAPSAETLAAIHAWFSTQWQIAVRRVLGEEHVPDDAHGVDLRPCGDAGYISKMGLEMSSIAKEGRTELHRSPIEIGVDYATTHSKRDGELWQTYARAMKGARMLTWSGGLLDLLGLKEEDEPPEELNKERVIAIDDIRWHKVRDVRGAKLGLLVAAEEGGAAAVEALLDFVVKNGCLPPRRVC